MELFGGCFACLLSGPLPILPHPTVCLGGGSGLTHSLGYLVVCFSQSEGLAGDRQAGKGKSLGGYLLPTQVMSPAVTVLRIQLLLGGPFLLSPSCHLSGSGSWLC